MSVKSDSALALLLNVIILVSVKITEECIQSYSMSLVRFVWAEGVMLTSRSLSPTVTRFRDYVNFNLSSINMGDNLACWAYFVLL